MIPMKRSTTLAFLTLLWANPANAAVAGLNAVPALPESRASEKTVASPEDADFWGGFWNETGGISWKEFLLRANLSYRSFYTDNALIIPITRKDDFLQYISPLIDIMRGFENDSRSTIINVSYQPTFVISSFGNGTDRNYQLVRANIVHSWNERQLSIEHQYQNSSEASTQISYLAPQNSNITRAGFQTPITGKISGTVGFEQSLTTSTPADTQLEQDLNSWMGSVGARYEILPKLSTGIGFSGGYAEQVSPKFHYSFTIEKLVSSWTYQLSGKVGVNFEVGGQLVQSQVVGIRDPHLAPVLNLQAYYEPRYGTQITLSGGTSAGASQFFNANFLTQTGVDLSVRQRIYEQFAVLGRMSYTDGRYQSLRIGAPNLDRNYTGLSFSAEVEWRVNARLRTSLFYQYLSRVSEFSRDSFSANQFGLNVNLAL